KGREMLIKNITHIFYWKRNPKIPWSAALREAPIQIPYVVEPQGEAIAIDNQGNGLYTISERPFGLQSYLYYFEKIQYTIKQRVGYDFTRTAPLRCIVQVNIKPNI